VREHSNEPQDSDDFELYFLAFVGDVLRQMMQPKKQGTECQGGERQNHAHHDHERVCLARSGDEGWQIVRSGWVDGANHVLLATFNELLPSNPAQPAMVRSAYDRQLKAL
jgi:hypothetical protein